jgi:hypothetical protein
MSIKEARECQDEDEILTVPEIAARLRLAPSWIYRHADLLGAYRLGKYLRFSWGEVTERLGLLQSANLGSQNLGSQPNDPGQGS